MGQGVSIYKITARDALQDTVFTAPFPAIVLDSRKTHVTFYFSHVDSATNTSLYYQLAPFDDRPLLADSVFFARYINLPGGKYTFSITEDYGKTLSATEISIAKSFWQKTWFIPVVLAYILLIMAVVMISIRTIRYKQELRLEALRRKIASDLHDDLGGTLAGISVMAGMGMRPSDPGKQQMLLERINRDVREMMLHMRGILWAVSPGNDLAIDFFDKICNSFRETFQLHGIQTTCTSQMEDGSRMTVEQQHHIFLLIKEIASNTIKHSRATETRYIFWGEGPWILMQLSDNGIGFDPAQAQSGHGLSNIHMRIASMNGEITMESGAAGTTYRIRFPIA